jgi:hypothetical protein
MNLKPGYYKFSKGEGRHKTFHYVHIFMDNSKKLFMRIDNSIEQDLSSENESALIDFRENYTLVKEYSKLNPTAVNMPRITISFKDEDGDPHEMSVRSLKRFEELLELFPRLRKALE